MQSLEFWNCGLSGHWFISLAAADFLKKNYRVTIIKIILNNTTSSRAEQMVLHHSK